MSVNISGLDKNPFKVGDKVRVKASVLSTFPVVFKNFLSVKYAIVTGVESYRVFTNVDDEHTHFEHFELYKEEKDMTQQTQQKTKRVPFTHELWEKWKDKGGKVIYANGPHIIKDMVCFNNATTTFRYAGYCEERDCVYVCEGDDFSLEIHITSKRIPFNPELKDAKVFTTDSNQPVVDWVMFKDGSVACQWPNQYMGYYPTNLLEMEIEE